MDAATGSRARAPSARPNASWVELSVGYVSSISRGVSGAARAGGGARRQLIVAEPGQEAGQHRGGLSAGAGDERLPRGAGRRAEQALVLGVRHRLEPSLEPRAPGLLEHGLELPAPAKLDHPPATR